MRESLRKHTWEGAPASGADDVLYMISGDEYAVPAAESVPMLNTLTVQAAPLDVSLTRGAAWSPSPVLYLRLA